MQLENKKRVYIIAEAGINFNGSLQNCLRLIDASADAGCDAVKFQFFKANSLYPKYAGDLDWGNRTRRYRYNIYNAAKSFELPKNWVPEIIKYCRSKKIEFLSSVFDIEGAVFLVKKGMKRIKIPSYCITNLPLIDRCASFGLPMLISTGGSTLGETEEALYTANKYHNSVSILHCSLKYPTLLKECNLGVIETLRMAFRNNLIGYSDHSKEISDAPVQAVYLGAGVVEKHITLDKRMDGPDHFFALEPQELKQMVKDIRDAEITVKKGKARICKIIYGDSTKKVHVYEKYLRNFAFMKLFAKRNIHRGEIIKHSDIIILRPGKKKGGLVPKYINLFKDFSITAKRDIHAEEPISWGAIFK